MKKVILGIGICFVAIFVVLQFNGISTMIGNIAEDQSYMRHDKIVQKVRTSLIDREQKVTINYVGKKESVESYAKDIIYAALLIDDKAVIDDFDYLKHVYRGFTANITGFGVFYKIHYEFIYSETKDETNWVCEQVKKIVSDMELKDKSTYDKVKKIHDYIIDNISYDLTVKNNSAYEGLMTRATACQGYANLTYIMLTQAGVNSRIITGYGDGVPHAWNIVEIDGLWYNIDCTWDDPVGGGNHKERYSYFLKCDFSFKEHVRDEEYDTQSFKLQHRMSPKNYHK